jgi:hypothetical protein
VKFVSEKGEKPREKPEPKPKPIPFGCEYCGKERHLAEFCYKRKTDERLAREQANQDRYRQSHGIPEPRVSLPRGVGSVRSVGRVGRFPQEKMYITFGDNGRGRVISEGVVHVSDKVTLNRVALVKSLGFNLLSVS